MSLPLPNALLLVHVAATWIMVGIIWFVQVVHYPLFRRVGPPEFAAYEAAHAELTTWVVVPPMVLELTTAVLLLAWPPAGLSRAPLWGGLALLAVIWLSTAFLQVPRHGVLAGGFDASAHAGLVLTNWIRTLSWSVRGVLTLACQLSVVSGQLSVAKSGEQLTTDH